MLSWLVVDASSRRRGIGSALVRHAIGLHPGRRVFSSTNESNEPSRRLFASLDFTSAGRIDALDEGDPELVLVRWPDARA
jgi:ribosomal protein S18 acetylase RimI-like enzyme